MNRKTKLTFILNVFILIGSKESRWMESTKEIKFLEIWVSTVWLFC
jgi:hypothetical protein